MGYRTGRKKSQRRRISLTSRVGGVTTELRSSLGGTGDRFGDYSPCVYRANLPCVSRHNQLTNTKFARPITKIRSLLRREEEEEEEEEGSIQFGRIFTRR